MGKKVDDVSAAPRLETDAAEETPVEAPPSLLLYKEDLDKYLQRIPDKPTIPGLPSGADSNSIIHQKTYIKPIPQKPNVSKRKQPKRRSDITPGTPPPAKRQWKSRWDSQ